MFIGIKNVPIPISGLLLSFFSLGNLIKNHIPYLKEICFTLGLFLLILISLKIILYPKKIKEELENPTISTVSGTYSMGLMSFSIYFLNYSYNLSLFIWVLGIIIHISLILYFTNNFFFKNFEIEKVYACFFVLYVGINNGAITSYDLNQKEFGHIIYLFGLVNLIFLFPLIFFRYLFYNNIPENNKPLILVFNAGTHITLEGYINSSEVINKHVIYFYIICLLIYLFCLYKVYEYRNIKFYPSFSSFTFPFVISAKATNGICDNVLDVLLIKLIFYFQLIFCTISVFYVFILYLKFLFKQ